MKLIARTAVVLLTIAFITPVASVAAPPEPLPTSGAAAKAAPVKPAEGYDRWTKNKGRDLFSFSLEPNMNAKGKTIPGLRIAHISAYSKCSRGMIPTFYSDTYGFKIKNGKVSINKTFKNKPISNAKITFKAQITFTGPKKAKGWYSINDSSQCKSDKKKTIKSFKFTTANGVG